MDDHIPSSGGDGPATKRSRTQGLQGQDNGLPATENNTEHQQDEAQHHASDVDQNGPEAEAGPQLSEDLDSMTETVKAGMFMIQSRTEAADAKVSELKCHSFNGGHDIAVSACCCEAYNQVCLSSRVSFGFHRTACACLHV